MQNALPSHPGALLSASAPMTRDRATDVLAICRFRGEREHAVAAFFAQGREKSLAPGISPLDHDHAVLAEAPFLFATGGIEVLVIFLELAEDLRFAVPVIAELRALDLQKITEGFVRVQGIGDVKERIWVDGMLEIRLPPRIAESRCRAKPTERDVERGDLQLMIERPNGMFVESFGGQFGISILQCVVNILG